MTTSLTTIGGEELVMYPSSSGTPSLALYFCLRRIHGSQSRIRSSARSTTPVLGKPGKATCRPQLGSGWPVSASSATRKNPGVAIYTTPLPLTSPYATPLPYAVRIEYFDRYVGGSTQLHSSLPEVGSIDTT